MKKSQVSALVASLLMCSCSPQRSAEGNQKTTQTETTARKAISVDPGIVRDLDIKVAKVEASTVGTPIAATGQLQINEDASWQVGAITDGKIISVPVRVGDSVREGQVLAVLHSHEIHDARATYRQAVAQLAREKVLSEQARTVRDRTRRLFALRAASREQVDAAETMYSSTTNTVATAQADVDKAKFHLTEFLEVPADVGEDHEESSHDGLSIKAPASGTVMERRATAGTVVSAGDPVFTIADLSSLWLIASVNEADMSRIRSGQKVQIVVRAFPDRKFLGSVLRLGERLDTQTRTLQVRVLVPNAAGLLKPDMFATTEFETGETAAAIHLPESAIQMVGGKPVVFMPHEGGSFRPQDVRVGSKSGDRVEVLSGVGIGDSVVVSGAFLLKTQLMKDTGE